MRNYYPLTAAQKMHHNWILDYGTQQVSGVSVVASVQAELDFGLLKKCIQMEMERSDCTRVRFTKPDKDGNVKFLVDLTTGQVVINADSIKIGGQTVGDLIDEKTKSFSSMRSPTV